MCWTRALGILLVLSLIPGFLGAADVILNEYNAVSSTDFLGGGDSSADDSGGRAFDSYFGRIQGNGGDWFELVVVKDHLDMRGWQLDVFNDGKLDKTLTLTSNPLWSDLRSGSLITVAEDVPNDVGYDPAAGDWSINVQAGKNGDGKYITAGAFAVSSSNWQLRIRNVAGTIMFGPAGEGVSPRSGVGSDEVFLLKADPDASVTANSADYDTNRRFSTFGAPNRWGTQDFNDVRPVLTPKAGSFAVVEPNGGETITQGDIVTVRWQNTDTTEPVLVEFSLDDGASWTPVYPPNIGNTGTYKWLVPLVAAEKALIRVSSVHRPFVYDTSDAPFTILAGPVGAVVGAGVENLLDYIIAASIWLD